MIALKITEIKDFMNKLLIAGDFDQFCLVEATITTYNTFSIDGEINRDFFDTDARDLLEKKHLRYSPWKEVRPWCLSVIRGKRTPVSFKIIFQLSPRQMDAFYRELPASVPPELIRGVYLNIQYKNKEILITNGISLKTFSMDRSAEHLWDSMIRDFFQKHEIAFESF